MLCLREMAKKVILCVCCVASVWGCLGSVWALCMVSLRAVYRLLSVVCLSVCGVSGLVWLCLVLSAGCVERVWAAV
jgi:hypothetical protein